MSEVDTVTENERIERIRYAHKLRGTDQPWTRERLFRLCRLLGCRSSELAALFCVTEQRISGWIAADRIPPHFALHLAQLEQAYWRAKFGAASAVPVVPVWEFFNENEKQEER